ncbi:hypothetical protein LSAT2_001037 [Lamellibrachia satsuma]|nr:hypothetical protein LSAT2_001037 [Lamellibrachia satsuma]
MLAPTPSSHLSPASPRSMGSARSRSASIFVNKHLNNAGLTHLVEFHEKNENRKKMAVIFGAFAALLAVCVAQEFFFLATAIDSRQRAHLLRDTLAGYGQWEPLARAFTNERACSWLYMASNRSTELWVHVKAAYFRTDEALEKSSVTTNFLQEIGHVRGHLNGSAIEWYSRVMQAWTANLMDGLDGTWRQGSVLINLGIYKSLLLAYDASGRHTIG